jgi:hypothetical protein
MHSKGQPVSLSYTFSAHVNTRQVQPSVHRRQGVCETARKAPGEEAGRGHEGAEGATKKHQTQTGTALAWAEAFSVGPDVGLCDYQLPCFVMFYSLSV